MSVMRLRVWRMIDRARERAGELPLDAEHVKNATWLELSEMLRAAEERAEACGLFAKAGEEGK